LENENSTVIIYLTLWGSWDMRGLTCFSAEKNRWDNICRTVLKGLNSYISLLRNRRLMRKASNFKVINIWFSYGIPIGSRRILQFPRYSDYRIQLSEIVGSDIRQLPVGFRFQGIRQLPTGSCRKLSDYLGFPVGSDGIRAWDFSSWEANSRRTKIKDRS
jgi:hypothetical protein